MAMTTVMTSQYARSTECRARNLRNAIVVILVGGLLYRKEKFEVENGKLRERESLNATALFISNHLSRLHCFSQYRNIRNSRDGELSIPDISDHQMYSLLF